MDTDKHGWEQKRQDIGWCILAKLRVSHFVFDFLSVSICVHPWLNSPAFLLPLSGLIPRGFARILCTWKNLINSANCGECKTL